MNMNCNIVLTGFMGAGKTSLGKAVSKILQVPFLDTDDLIVQSEGMPVSEIFRTKGEDYFRSLETETVRALGDRGERQGERRRPLPCPSQDDRQHDLSCSCCIIRKTRIN